MLQYADTELEFLRREIIKKYASQAKEADELVMEIPQYPKSVGDEKFNFLSGYVEMELHRIALQTKERRTELDEFRKEHYVPNYSLSATLKKLFCEQHYKITASERKTEQFMPKSINRFYLYFSGKIRCDYLKDTGAVEINKIFETIETEIQAYKEQEKEPVSEVTVNTIELKSLKQVSFANAERPGFYKAFCILLSCLLVIALLYYVFNLLPALNAGRETIAAYRNKMVRTPALAKDAPGLMGTWISYNRTPETIEQNRLKGKIFRGIEWKIDSDRNGNLVFTRHTTANNNEGWVELMNMQVNFFMNVQPKFSENKDERNFGFRHFICKPNKVDLNNADTLWCGCTSFIHKDGRLDDPLVGREILIRKKEGQHYPTDLLIADSLPDFVKTYLGKDKSYLKIIP